MEYQVGQRLRWIPKPACPQRDPEVTVVELRRNGIAKLSNGWFVDEDGYADGTRMSPGGRVEALYNPAN